MKAFSSGQESFGVTFSNNFRVSVVFGEYTYSDKGQTTCEIAVADSRNNWMIRNDDSTWVTVPQFAEVMSRKTANELAVIMYEVSNMKL